MEAAALLGSATWEPGSRLRRSAELDVVSSVSSIATSICYDGHGQDVDHCGTHIRRKSGPQRSNQTAVGPNLEFDYFWRLKHMQDTSLTDHFVTFIAVPERHLELSDNLAKQVMFNAQFTTSKADMTLVRFKV